MMASKAVRSTRTGMSTPYLRCRVASRVATLRRFLNLICSCVTPHVIANPTRSDVANNLEVLRGWFVEFACTHRSPNILKPHRAESGTLKSVASSRAAGQQLGWVRNDLYL